MHITTVLEKKSLTKATGNDSQSRNFQLELKRKIRQLKNLPSHLKACVILIIIRLPFDSGHPVELSPEPEISQICGH